MSDNPLFDLGLEDVSDLTVPQDEPVKRKTVKAKKVDRAEPVKVSQAVEEENLALPSSPITPDGTVNLKDLTQNPNLFNPKMPANIKHELMSELARREEIEAEIVKQKGRYIEAVDNARPGVTFTGRSSNASPSQDGFAGPQEFAQPLAVSYQSDGITTTGTVFDTGAGAQEKESIPDFSPDDPNNPNFVVCGNGNCPYRETCLRYRMKNQKENKFVFFPEQCRLDGIYINIEDSAYTAYPPFSVLESTSTPNF